MMVKELGNQKNKTCASVAFGGYEANYNDDIL
jgi:hypothetical protein